MTASQVVIVLVVAAAIVFAVSLVRKSKPSPGPRYGGAPYDPNTPSGTGDGSVSPPSGGTNQQ